MGDFNGDGRVDVMDLGVLAQNYGATAASSIVGITPTAQTAAASPAMGVTSQPTTTTSPITTTTTTTTTTRFASGTGLTTTDARTSAATSLVKSPFSELRVRHYARP
jgi:hypothetical protein